MVRLAGVEPATLGLEVGGNTGNISLRSRVGSTLDLAAGRLSRRTTQSTGPVLVQAGRWCASSRSAKLPPAIPTEVSHAPSYSRLLEVIENREGCHDARSPETARSSSCLTSSRKIGVFTTSSRVSTRLCMRTFPRTICSFSTVSSSATTGITTAFDWSTAPMEPALFVRR
jgi:hypothetical protein